MSKPKLKRLVCDFRGNLKDTGFIFFTSSDTTAIKLIKANIINLSNIDNGVVVNFKKEKSQFYEEKFTVPALSSRTGYFNDVVYSPSIWYEGKVNAYEEGVTILTFLLLPDFIC